MTRVFSDQNLDEVASVLASGEPVAIPTETVYGLAAPIFNEVAVQKIFSLKGRPSDNPLIAHVSSISMAESIAQEIPESFYLLAKRFWPGPLTLVLPRKECVPKLVSAGQGSIAIRMPAHPIALNLIEQVGEPLVAPSANISGRPSPTCLAHVLEDFEGKLSAVVDGGVCQIGIESTVLSLLSDVPVLLRPGSITKQQLEEALGLEILLPQSSEPVHSPGMKYRHYAPNGAINIVDSVPSLPAGAFVLSRDPIDGIQHRALNAKELFAHLREADILGAEEIWVLTDPITMASTGLMNRLLKAASKV